MADRTGQASVEVEALHKRYDPETVALQDVSMHAEAGQVVALLGRNGSGKTTTVRILAGLLSATGGMVEICGRPPRRAVAEGCIGYASQDVALYPKLTARQNLAHFGALSGVATTELTARVDDRLVSVGLDDVADTPVSRLSGGQRRRVHVAVATMSAAPVLLLDEPTAGVDLDSRERLVNQVKSLARRGHAIIYTTHDLGDADRVADVVYVIDAGHIAANSDAVAARSGPGLLQLTGCGPAAFARLQGQPDSFVLGNGSQDHGESIYLELQDGTAVARRAAELEAEVGEPLYWRSIPPGIESFFIRSLAPSRGWSA